MSALLEGAKEQLLSFKYFELPEVVLQSKPSFQLKKFEPFRMQNVSTDYVPRPSCVHKSYNFDLIDLTSSVQLL